MGRATVVSEYGAGQYRVAVAYDRSAADTRISKLNTAAATIRANLPGYQVKIDAAVVQVTNAQTALTSAMTDYQSAQAAGDQTAIAAAYVALGTAADQSAGAQNQLLQTQGDYNQQELRATALERQATTLGNNLDTASREVDAWCADYTEGLTGQVGTIEVGRIGVAEPIVHPGGAAGTGAAYSAARDGEITQTMALHPGAAFHSLAMLPGTNKWRPRYRLGVISAVDTGADTVDVDLDAATSPHQTLDINQSTSLSAVAADYMGLGASLYVVGDRVVVGFTEDLAADPTNVGSWSRPFVVGFESAPRATQLQIVGPEFFCRGMEYNAVGGTPPYTWESWLNMGGRAPVFYSDLGGYIYPASLEPSTNTATATVAWEMNVVDESPGVDGAADPPRVLLWVSDSAGASASQWCYLPYTWWRWTNTSNPTSTSDHAAAYSGFGGYELAHNSITPTNPAYYALDQASKRPYAYVVELYAETSPGTWGWRQNVYVYDHTKADAAIALAEAGDDAGAVAAITS